MPVALEVSLALLPEAALAVDVHGRVMAVNDLAAALFGPEGPFDTAGPVPTLGAIRGFGEWLAGKGVAVFETHLAGRRPNGVPVTVELRAHRLDGEGGALCLLTELDRARVASEAQRFFDIAFDTAPIGMALFNTDGEYVRVNAALCTMLGRRADELLGRRDQEFTHLEDRQSDVDAAWRILRGEIHTWQCEKRFLRPDGSVVWTIANLTFLRDDDGNPLSWVGQFQDITARKALEVTLLERERRTREILETAHEAFMSIDRQGCVTDWNPAAEATFGWARDEILGRSVIDALAPERDRDGLRAMLVEGRPSGVCFPLNELVEMTGLHRSGREFPVELTVWAVERDDEHAFNAFIRDISERKRTEEQLEQAHSEAVQASRMKSEFLANMSHEIRTPLNGVIGMSGLLLSSDLRSDQLEYAEVVRRSGETLLEIINDILDFSKIEAGKLELEQSEFDVGSLVEDVAELLAPEAQRKGLELTTITEPEIPSLVTGDPGRIRQILTNLVGNAIKFTPAGELSVRVSRQAGGATGAPMVHVAVRDTGPGIAAEDAKRLFDPFTQGDASTTRRFGGTGLGLAISRRLAELMGGSIGVESTPGDGSTFWFTVPLVPAAGAAWRPGRLSLLAGARVLVVDDNATSRAVLDHQLTRWGLATATAADGATGLEVLRTAFRAGRPIDVVLVDSELVTAGGLDLGHAIATDPEVASTTLILLTPVGRPRSPDGTTPNVHVAKPVRRSQLFDALADALGIGSGRATRESRPPALPDLPEALAG
ncbi:MAG: PAS domain S-box protein, partial [Acidimicrobiales bacterium]